MKLKGIRFEAVREETQTETQVEMNEFKVEFQKDWLHHADRYFTSRGGRDY